LLLLLLLLPLLLLLMQELGRGRERRGGGKHAIDGGRECGTLPRRRRGARRGGQGA
jgi:hypothetical protein